MEYNEEKLTGGEAEQAEVEQAEVEQTEATDALQEEIQFFAEEPDEAAEADLDAQADARAAEENADEVDACRMDDGIGFADDMDFSVDMDEETDGAALGLRDRLNLLRENCRALSERIADDMRATNGNPYIRSTTTYRYEILRNSKDTEPVDVFEFQRTSGASLRAMALTAAIVAAADVAVARIFKRK